MFCPHSRGWWGLNSVYTKGFEVYWFALDFSSFLSPYSFVVCFLLQRVRDLWIVVMHWFVKWLLTISPKFKSLYWIFLLSESYFSAFGEQNLLKQWKLADREANMYRRNAKCLQSFIHSLSFVSLVLSLTLRTSLYSGLQEKMLSLYIVFRPS